METAELFTEPAEVWIVEFRHPYFGWIDREKEHPSAFAAKASMKANPCPYPLRVRKIK